MWLIKWLNCYYLKNRKQNMNSCRNFAKALIFFDQDILISNLCENLNRNRYVWLTVSKLDENLIIFISNSRKESKTNFSCTQIDLFVTISSFVIVSLTLNNQQTFHRDCYAIAQTIEKWNERLSKLNWNVDNKKW